MDVTIEESTLSREWCEKNASMYRTTETYYRANQSLQMLADAPADKARRWAAVARDGRA